MRGKSCERTSGYKISIRCRMKSYGILLVASWLYYFMSSHQQRIPRQITAQERIIILGGRICLLLTSCFSSFVFNGKQRRNREVNQARALTYSTKKENCAVVNSL